MTSKDICKKCINETCRPWGPHDEELWRRRLVECPVVEPDEYGWSICHITVQRSSSTAFPPRDCLYAAEHVVLRER